MFNNKCILFFTTLISASKFLGRSMRILRSNSDMIAPKTSLNNIRTINNHHQERPIENIDKNHKEKNIYEDQKSVSKNIYCNPGFGSQEKSSDILKNCLNYFSRENIMHPPVCLKVFSKEQEKKIFDFFVQKIQENKKYENIEKDIKTKYRFINLFNRYIENEITTLGFNYAIEGPNANQFETFFDKIAGKRLENQAERLMNEL